MLFIILSIGLLLFWGYALAKGGGISSGHDSYLDGVDDMMNKGDFDSDRYRDDPQYFQGVEDAIEDLEDEDL